MDPVDVNQHWNKTVNSCEPAWSSGKVLSPFLIGRMFLREPSWKYSAKLVGS